MAPEYRLCCPSNHPVENSSCCAGALTKNYGLIGGIKPVFDESEAQQVKPEVVNQVAEARM